VLEVNPAVPVSSVPELIACIKAHSGKINLASFGTGTISHVAGMLFKTEAGIEMAARRPWSSICSPDRCTIICSRPLRTSKKENCEPLL